MAGSPPQSTPRLRQDNRASRPALESDRLAWVMGGSRWRRQNGLVRGSCSASVVAGVRPVA
eukprot:2020115-Pyramimonas_sp.AAC.1